MNDKGLIHGVTEMALKSDLNSNPNSAIFGFVISVKPFISLNRGFLLFKEKDGGGGIISVTFVERSKRYSVLRL